MNKKGLRYLLLFIGALLLTLLSTYIALVIVYMLVKDKMGISITQLINLISYIGNYFSEVVREDGLTWGNFIQNYFLNHPSEFENIKSISCMLQFVSYIPVLILLIFFLIKELKEDAKDYVKNWKRNILIIGIGVLVLLFSQLIVSTIYQLLGDTDTSVNEKTINLIMGCDGIWFMIISVVLIAPFVEELIYRKLLFGVCEKSFHLKPIWAIIISTLVFSLIHVSDLESLKYIFQYIALALPICLAYHFSRNNIYVSIGIHMINNFISAIPFIFNMEI